MEDSRKLDTAVRGVVRATRAIPAAGVREGDYIIVRPGHEDPLIVSHYPPAGSELELVREIRRMRVVSGEATLEELEAELRRRFGLDAGAGTSFAFGWMSDPVQA